MIKDLNGGYAGDKLKHDLISQIKSGQLEPNNAILAERKLADIYGLGYMTVRRAIDDLVAKGILYREPRKGTFVAEGGYVANNDSKVIAYIASDLKNQFNVQIIEALERKARGSSFNLMVCGSEMNVTQEASHLVKMSENNVAGIILSPCYPPINRDAVEKVIQRNIPIVMLDKHFNEIDTDFVECNNFEAAYQAVSYLISLGHKKIAHITSHSSLKNITSVDMRMKGYLKALKDNGIEFCEEYIQELDEISVHTEMSKIDINYLGYLPMKKLLDLKVPPTAVFMLNDWLAIGAFRAAKEKGISIPDDISLVGFNNDSFSSYLEVPLTTMSQPLNEIGEMAFKLILDKIEEISTSHQHMKISTKLIVRNSCKVLNEAVTEVFA